MPVWKQGQSGNPNGRPRGFKELARYIQEQTQKGKELVDFHLKVLRGEEIKCYAEENPREVVEAAYPSIKDRQLSAEWLANRGFGQAPEVVLDDEDDLPSLAKSMSDAELLEAVKEPAH